MTPFALADPDAARNKQREANRAYHLKRWATDPAYRERKRELARQQRQQPDYGEKRRARRLNWSQERREADAKRSKEWAVAHVSNVRARHLRRRYGLSPEDVVRMLLEQRGACALCNKLFGLGRPYNVDHCHKSGAVRGLLCTKCNTALGKFGDDPALLRKAAGYVEGAV